MPNSYFQFKQFTIQQERAAMKVSTDSSLFGAWAAHQLLNKTEQVQTILDIGAGTGLLMLLLAQQTTAQIDGIELDPASFEQALQNLHSSPWTNQFQLYNGDVKTHSFERKYDLIISNPPFYEGDLRSPSAEVNQAKHDTGLLLNELVSVAAPLLEINGQFVVLLPNHRIDSFIKRASLSELYPEKIVHVRQSVHHSYFRSMISFSHANVALQTEVLSVKDDDNEYTVEFRNLLQPYYLKL